jgi:hypothetical protein
MGSNNQTTSTGRERWDSNQRSDFICTGVSCKLLPAGECCGSHHRSPTESSSSMEKNTAMQARPRLVESESLGERPRVSKSSQCDFKV